MNLNEQDRNRADDILIVDDEPDDLNHLYQILSNNGYNVRIASDGQLGLKALMANLPDIILLDTYMPHIDGYEICRRLKTREDSRGIPVIFISADNRIDKAKGFHLGAVDYISKPFDAYEVLARVKAHLTVRAGHIKLEATNKQLSAARDELKRLNAVLEKRVQQRTVELESALEDVERLKERLREENLCLQDEIKIEHNFSEIIGNSPSLMAILRQVEQVAPSDTNVLILGESGTGKELLTRALHETSLRKEHPLVKVNCAALQANLIESELFGHEKGSFTGALSRRIGRFELAHEGTIFLDEIGDLPLSSQIKLLRVLQEGEFERLGSCKTQKVDVRVLVATNRDLAKLVSQGSFREDLFFRLNVFPIKVPPLRERKEDIPLLVKHFIKKHNAKLGKKVDTISTRALNTLQTYNWPGNIRELENIIERAIVISQGAILRLGDWFDCEKSWVKEPLQTLTLMEMEKQHIQKVLEKTGWRVSGSSGAAKILGLKPTTLEAKMKKLGIERPKRNL